jgi:hypothetical protein
MSLLLKVTRTNVVNGIMNEYAPKVIEAISSFTGKAYLATGMKSKKFSDLVESLNLPNFGNNSNVSVKINNSYGSLILNISVNFGGGFYETMKTDFYFGKVNDGVIILREDGFSPFKTDYSADAIQSAMNKVEALRSEIYQIEKEFNLNMFQ